MPYNPTTDNAYKGGNVIWLMTVANQKGYTDPRWMTYKQAQEKGWQVRKGEHGTAIAYWKRTETVKEKDPETGEERKVERNLDRPRPFYATVFNAQQIEGVPALQTKQLTWDPDDRAEAILSASGAKIIHGGNVACYRRGPDDIKLPPRASFRDAPAYYDTALHELGHWTGHPSRLNRQFGDRFGDANYAREELRAEMASLFISAEVGIQHDTSNQAAYVGSWIKALKEDKHELFRAARDAGEIADYVLALERAKTAQAEAEAPELTSEPHDEEVATQLEPPDPVQYYEPEPQVDWGYDR
jgi:antirestriction protein ArdC